MIAQNLAKDIWNFFNHELHELHKFKELYEDKSQGQTLRFRNEESNKSFEILVVYITQYNFGFHFNYAGICQASDVIRLPYIAFTRGMGTNEIRS
jgi:hypothetical protein